MSQWQGKVETSQPDVIRVLAEERQEKELRKAEMEATKVGPSSIRGALQRQQQQRRRHPQRMRMSPAQAMAADTLTAHIQQHTCMADSRCCSYSEWLRTCMHGCIRSIQPFPMHALQAQNLLEHEAEIYSRPARTWFQSEKEKKKAAAAAKAAEVEGAPAVS